MKPPGRFGFTAIVFNTFLLFTTLTEQLQVLGRVRNALKPGGKFWVDIFNPTMARLAEDVEENADVKLFYSRELRRSVLRTTTLRNSTRQQVRRVEFDYRWHDDDGREVKRKMKFELTWMFPRELESLLERAGFVIEKMMGDYDGSAIVQTSPRLILLARRK
jgi:hypothetical protein